MPDCDKKDILEESCILNEEKMTCPKHQHHPEFTQAAYLRLRSLEEAFVMKNYLDQKSFQAINDKMSLTQKITNHINRRVNNGSLITQHDRSYAVQKIFDLHIKKEYKVETLFIAVNVMDRYLATIGFWTFPREHMCRLATICMLIAAKLE